MQFFIDLPTIILLLGALQGYLLSFALLIKHRDKIANRILAVLILLYTLFVTGGVFSNLKLYDEYPHLMVTIGALPMVFGPLHYLYAKHLLAPILKFKKSEWLDFLAFLCYKLYVIPAYLMSPLELKQYMADVYYEEQLFVVIIINWLLVFQGLTYMMLTLYLLRKYSVHFKDTFSSLDKINLSCRSVYLFATVLT